MATTYCRVSFSVMDVCLSCAEQYANRFDMTIIDERAQLPSDDDTFTVEDSSDEDEVQGIEEEAEVQEVLTLPPLHERLTDHTDVSDADVSIINAVADDNLTISATASAAESLLPAAAAPRGKRRIYSSAARCGSKPSPPATKPSPPATTSAIQLPPAAAAQGRPRRSGRTSAPAPVSLAHASLYSSPTTSLSPSSSLSRRCTLHAAHMSTSHGCCPNNALLVSVC